MTLEEKSERHEVVNRLLKASNYINNDELKQLKEINDKCYSRYKNLSKSKVTGQIDFQNIK